MKATTVNFLNKNIKKQNYSLLPLTEFPFVFVDLSKDINNLFIRFRNSVITYRHTSLFYLRRIMIALLLLSKIERSLAIFLACLLQHCLIPAISHSQMLPSFSV